MKFIKLSLAAAILATATFAAESEVGVSANMAMTSNYVWRGKTQTSDSPAIQGGIDVDYKGFYAGVWGSNVEFGTASMEMDVYLGYAAEMADLSYDVGFIQFAYPNQMDELNFGEVYASVGYDFKVASVGLAYYVGVDTHDSGVVGAEWEPENAYEVSVSVPLPQEITLDVLYGDYDSLGAYYSVGVSKSYGEFDLSAAYVANDGAGVTADEEDNFTLTVGASF